MITIGLDQEAIEKALTNYIEQDAMNVDLSEKEVKIKLTAGRGENGLRADILVTDRTPSTEASADVETDPVSDPAESPEEEAAVPSGPFD